MRKKKLIQTQVLSLIMICCLGFILGCFGKSLHKSIKEGDFQTAERLIHEGADINTPTKINGFKPLHLAAINGDLHIAKLLLGAGVDVDTKVDSGWLLNKGWTPVMLAIEKGHTEMVNFLISRGANIEAQNQEGGTPLIVASYNGHPNIVELLIEKGAQVNTRSIAGQSPLRFAVMQNHFEIAKLLISNGSHIDDKDANGWTPLMSAVQNGNKELIDFLLEKGADIEAENNNGERPLFIAISSRHPDIVDLLLDRGAKVNTKTKESLTPLHMAVLSDQEELAQKLIRLGSTASIVENTPENTYATAVIYKLAADEYLNRKDTENAIKHLTVAAEYSEKAAPQIKKTSRKLAVKGFLQAFGQGMLKASQQDVIRHNRQVLYGTDKTAYPFPRSSYNNPPEPVSTSEVDCLEKKYSDMYERCQKISDECRKIIDEKKPETPE
ncbi:MAG: ankyrin repeat domain-containing protein [Thermodesulfobacteriota bacterium]